MFSSRHDIRSDWKGGARCPQTAAAGTKPGRACCPSAPLFYVRTKNLREIETFLDIVMQHAANQARRAGDSAPYRPAKFPD